MSAGLGPSQANRKRHGFGGTSCCQSHPKARQDATAFCGNIRPSHCPRVTKCDYSPAHKVVWELIINLDRVPDRRGVISTTSALTLSLWITEGRTKIREIEIQFIAAQTSWVAYLWHMTRARLPVGGWLGER